MWRRGTHLSASESEGKRTGLGREGRWAVGCIPGWASLSPQARSYFFPSSFLFLFCFLFSFVTFITFAFALQINSNQFLKFYKIQHIILKQ
jgi:hypothetical protein